MSALRFLLACSFVMLSGAAVGSACPAREYTEPADVDLRGDTVLIVTHATSLYDPRYSTKHGIDAALRYAKSRGIPVVYLESDDTPERSLSEDCRPDYRVRSQDGEVMFEVSATHVLVAGGHLELCLSRTLHDVLDRWSRQPPRQRTLTYLMDAIYSNGKLVDPEDGYYDDLQRFMGIVTYGRPGGETWPKLNLLETMGVIGRLQHELDYLRRILPQWERTFPANVRVEMQVNGMAKQLLRRGADAQAGTLLFHFVNSASDLAASPFSAH